MGDWPLILTCVAVGAALGRFCHPLQALGFWLHHSEISTRDSRFWEHDVASRRDRLAHPHTFR